MSYCQRCKRHYREPPDEQGDHECPHCGLLPHEREPNEHIRMDTEWAANIVYGPRRAE
jgi:hypothetical protein